MTKYLKRAAFGSAIMAASLLVGVAPAHALVNTADIADGAVTTAQIAHLTILGADLATGSVASRVIEWRSVMGSNLATDSVAGRVIQDGSINGVDLAPDIAIASDVTRVTSATGSFQNVAADLTYQGAAGATSSFHAAVMGHFHGDTLTNTNNYPYHAGVIGAYSVATSDAITGPKAGVIGTIGVDGDASTAASAAVMAVLDGGDPGAVITADAAYGVQYLNATSSAKFSYGLDLFHAASAPYPAVTYGTADIRLASGATISSGSSNPGTCVKGSINLNTSDGKLYTCSATNTWVVTGSQS